MTENNPTAEGFPTCGGHDLMKKMNQESEGFLTLSDQFMKQLTKVIHHQKRNKSSNDLYVVPIVFHIVYNTPEENIPDSVITNQLEILNESFRRQNADTSETRAEFYDLVGDSRIEFKLAEFDPLGAPSSGITRTNSDVKNFGGILPYGPGQNAQIANWVNDSLYYNYFRLTNSNLGGKDPWDTDLFLNVWIGDLRIFEPQFNNFEEMVFFALATPPMDHVNWPDSILQGANSYEQGVLIHYVNIGSNNPNQLPAPYAFYNGIVNTGKILVHEVGHYLGLRHIWGDGDCNYDDFIEDTPNSAASSSWACNSLANTCTDSIGNLDLRDMVENYMDYSSGDCQNSFTLGQIDLMRSVLRNYRGLLFDTISSVNSYQLASLAQVKCYPNPTTGALFVDLGQYSEKVQLSVQNYLGQTLFHNEYKNTQLAKLDLDVSPGIYFLTLNYGYEQSVSLKFIKE